MPNRAGTRRERDKKNFVLDTVSPDPSWSVPKNNSKKIQKIKKHYSSSISKQTESRKAKKETKKFSF